MDPIFDAEAWQQILVSSFTALGSSVMQFLPKLLGMVVILGVGWLLSKILEVASRRALRSVGLDRLAGNLHVAGTLKKAGIMQQPSLVVSRLLFWILMLTFTVIAIEALGLHTATSVIDRLIAYVPKVIVSGLIVIIGLFVAGLARRVVVSTALVAEMASANRLGAATQGLVAVLVVILAIEQLGVDTKILVATLTALLAALTLSAGGAFALGARPIVTHILAGHFLRQNLQHGRTVEVMGREGEVELVGPIETLFRSGDRSWTIPNARVLEEVRSA